MIKKRYFSAHNDFKTGIVYKIFLIVGAALLTLFLIQRFTDIILIDNSILEIMFAFSIILIGTSLIVFYLKVQFTKLADIADDIEKGNK